MNKYKIKLTHEQMKHLQQSIVAMMNYDFVKENINHITFYNTKSFLKRLHDKLYHLSTVKVVRTFKYQITIDANEHKALIDVNLFGKSVIENSPYLQILFIDIFNSIDKQELEIRHSQLTSNPPVNIDMYKYQIDNNKFS